MIKAIIRQAQIEHLTQEWSRHVPPRPFVHIRISGITAKQAFNAFNEAASGVFVFGHPTLGRWDAVPELYKDPDGHPLHCFAGRPSLVSDGLSWDSEIVLDVMVLGQIFKWCNDTDAEGEPYLAIGCSDDATLLDSIQPAAIVWRSDGAVPWSAVAAKYKEQDGNPRIDIGGLPYVDGTILLG